MKLNNHLGNTIMAVMVILGLVSCKKPIYYNISTAVQPADGGSIVVTPSTESVLEGTTVTFKATPNGDYIFSGWSGSLSGTENPATIVASSNLNVIANFTLKTYPLTVTVEGEGTVSERIVSSKAEYDSGTVVELTATPATGWSFDHWEEDLTGAENPSQITVSSAKSVKAMFTKNKYAYNLTIVGPGVVDEYLVESTKATLDYDTQLKLVAVPAKENAVFKGWSGDIKGTDPEIFVNISDNISITATFEKVSPQYQLPDYNKPSVFTKALYPGRDFSSMLAHPNSGIVVDYNMDGLLDIIAFPTKWLIDFRPEIEFYLGKEDGSFVEDRVNSDKHIVGPNNERKTIIGEFNGDGYPDICLISHGYDSDPYPGDYPIILLSNGNGGFTDHRYTELIGYFHSGASGDFDNDGDIDLFYLDGTYNHSAILLNDGRGNFSVREDLMPEDTKDIYTCDVADFNNDGFLDLLLGSCNYSYKTTGTGGKYTVVRDQVIWGNGISFANNAYTVLPPPAEGFAGTQDFALYDLDGDGTNELISARMVDRIKRPDSDNWGIQVLRYVSGEIIDVSTIFSSRNENWPSDSPASSITWLGVEEFGSDKVLAATLSMTPNSIPLFYLNNGTFTKAPEKLKVTKGFPVYGDSFDGVDCFIIPATQSVAYDLSCSIDPGEGAKCIRFFEGWGVYSGIDYVFQHYIDIKDLVEQDYCLEFYVKNNDPSLEIEFKFYTEEGYDIEGLPRYYYNFRSANTRNDGTWEIVRIPLKEFHLWNAPTGENHWDRVKIFNILITSSGGKEFFLDEIRIRKVLLEN